MTDTLMCQSVVSNMVEPFPCGLTASRVLFGVHLCGNHDNQWRQRVASGEKIRVHPDRTLPLDHRCAPPDASVLRTCRTCGESKPVSDFYRNSSGNRTPMSVCKRCWNARTNPKARRLRASAAPDSPAVTSSPDAQQGARPPEGDASPAPSAPAGRPPDRTTHHTLSLRHGLPSAEVAWPPPSMRTPTSAIDAWDKQMGTAQLPTPDRAPAASVSRPAADPLTPGRLGQYVYVIEFTCSLCGRWVCDVEVGSRNAVALPKPARCLVIGCGGSAQRSGEVRQKYIGPTGAAFWDTTSYERSAWAADEDVAS